MTGQTREPALLCPPSVAVHDDSDMAWDLAHEFKGGSSENVRAQH